MDNVMGELCEKPSTLDRLISHGWAAVAVVQAAAGVSAALGLAGLVYTVSGYATTPAMLLILCLNLYFN